MATLPFTSIPTEDQTFIDEVTRKRLGRRGALLGILEDVQEHHPHSLHEGMLIGAYAVGARQGIIYVRADPMSAQCQIINGNRAIPSPLR